MVRVARDAYCPFGIESDPDEFDLVPVSVETRYGAVMSRVSRKQTSETGTMYIHGVGADWTTWTPIMRAEVESQAGAHDQIFVNMPSFGDSENRVGSLDIADVGTTLISVAATLGYSRLRVVGQSMGGFLTLDMASRHQDRIDSIHLAAGPYFSILRSIQHPLLSFASSPTVAATFETQYLLAMTGGLGSRLLKSVYEHQLLPFLLFPFASHPLQLKESVVRSLCYQQNPQGLIQTAANGGGYDADKQWGKIECPIWATFGRNDKMVPQRDMIRMLKCQPAAKCTTIMDASHLHHIERPFSTLRGLGLWP
jgi:pimeloyl-ACP methyl ester carboxylesterase